MVGRLPETPTTGRGYIGPCLSPITRCNWYNTFSDKALSSESGRRGISAAPLDTRAPPEPPELSARRPRPEVTVHPGTSNSPHRTPFSSVSVCFVCFVIPHSGPIAPAISGRTPFRSPPLALAATRGRFQRGVSLLYLTTTADASERRPYLPNGAGTSRSRRRPPSPRFRRLFARSPYTFLPASKNLV